MNYFKRLETIIIALIILVLGVAFGILNNKTKTPASENKAKIEQQDQKKDQPQQEQQLVPSAFIQYPGQDGKNALELLKSSHRVETQNFSGVGEFVKSIDGVEPDSSHFWALYVNGQQSQVGADSYITKSSDNIEWKLEKIN
jgi:hypothetical protein